MDGAAAEGAGERERCVRCSLPQNSMSGSKNMSLIQIRILSTFMSSVLLSGFPFGGDTFQRRGAPSQDPLTKKGWILPEHEHSVAGYGD